MLKVSNTLTSYNHEIYISDRVLINFRVMPGENASSQTATNSIRTINEHFLIADTFFDDISREQLIDGFGGRLVHRSIPTDAHLNIEKTLLYFTHNRWLDKPYKMIGLLRMSHLLNDPVHCEILVKSYGIDDMWLQHQMGEIDVLRPKIAFVASHSKSILFNTWRRLLAQFSS